MSAISGSGKGKLIRGPCEACTNVLWLIMIAPSRDIRSNSWHNPTSSKGHWPSFKQLSKSSRTCDLCALILASIQSGPKSKSDEYWVVTKPSYYDSTENGPGIQQLRVSRGLEAPRYIRVYAEAGGHVFPEV